MHYKNYTQEAIYELERQRTGNYGMDYEYEHSEVECELCKTEENNLYEVNSHIYCGECICDMLRELFYSAAQGLKNEEIDAFSVLNDIISDFSDNEILCYVENIYERKN